MPRPRVPKSLNPSSKLPVCKTVAEAEAKTGAVQGVAAMPKAAPSPIFPFVLKKSVNFEIFEDVGMVYPESMNIPMTIKRTDKNQPKKELCKAAPLPFPSNAKAAPQTEYVKTKPKTKGRELKKAFRPLSPSATERTTIGMIGKTHGEKARPRPASKRTQNPKEY